MSKTFSEFILHCFNDYADCGSTLVFIDIAENYAEDTYELKYTDDGKPFDPDIFKNMHDPSAISEKFRKYGLGLMELIGNIEGIGGKIIIANDKDNGIAYTLTCKRSDPKRPAIGNIADTLSQLSSTYPTIDIDFTITTAEDSFHFDTREVKFVLEDVSISNPGVQKYIKTMIAENIDQIKAT